MAWNSALGTKQYVEAEKQLRQGLQERQRALGTDHAATLYSQHWLGRLLFDHQKYGEAEQVLREVLQRRDSLLGAENEDTLNSKHWLGMTYYNERKYVEAQQLLWQTVLGKERLMGVEHAATLDSKYRLSLTYFRQRKYIESEKLLRQIVQARERDRGFEHRRTLDGKHWLGCTLFEQQEYVEAARFLRQAVQGRKKNLGAKHKETIESSLALQRTVQKLAPLASVVTAVESMMRTALSALLIEGRNVYTNADFDQISSTLKDIDRRWSKVPRTFIILHILECQNHLEDFIKSGFSDHCFPVTERSLPMCLSPAQGKEFVAVQQLVMTDPMDLEKGDQAKHAYFGKEEEVPFEEKEALGAGGFGKSTRYKA